MEDLTNIKAFFNFMIEREQIRLRKEADLSFPWTNDPILRKYKFTNVYRFHDWTTTKLREEFYSKNRDKDKKTILMNCALFRYFGTFEFAEAVGWQAYDDFDFNGIIKIATERLAAKERVFTGAYIITNQGISAPKQKVVVNHFLRKLHKELPVLIEVMQLTRSWQKVSETMSSIPGFGGSGFMTKEVLLDTMMTDFWGADICYFDNYKLVLPTDYESWTPIGPGALRGVARLLGYEDLKASKELKFQALKTILSLTSMQESYWPEEYGKLFPTDIQFQLCEFDKYERVRLGQGRPRSQYIPRRAQEE